MAASGTATGVLFTQINLHQSSGATLHLVRGLAATHTYIALIQEPSCKKGSVVGLKNAGTVYYGNCSERPRACIVTRGIRATMLPQLSGRDVTTVLVRVKWANGERNIIICSAYFPYDSPSPPPPEGVVKVIDFCKNKGLPLVMGCDANSHHEVWGSSDTNARGEKLLEYLSTVDLNILNRGRM